MILIAVVGFGFVFGMPYLLDSSTCPPSTFIIFSSRRSLLIFHLLPSFDSPFPHGLSTQSSPPAVDPETRAEFEEQQKKSILNTSGAGANPLQNFDMAAWMAGKTSGASSSSNNGGGGRDGEGRSEGGKARRRG